MRPGAMCSSVLAFVLVGAGAVPACAIAWMPHLPSGFLNSGW